MNALIALITATTFILLLSFALRLRNWVRSMRRDIYDIRDELRALKKSNENVGAEIVAMTSNIADETVNATCINSLGFKFPVFLGDWSIDSFLGRHLVQHILEHRPKCIVELGSGSSSIIIARTLKTLNEKEVRHIAVDHEAKYLAMTRDIALLNEVADGIEFLHCPLVQYDSLDKLWYGGISEKLTDLKIDLLIIDGPPAHLQPLSRYPALPILLPYLSEHCTVILDDAGRKEEKAIAQRWNNENPEFNLTFTNAGHGLAILTR